MGSALQGKVRAPGDSRQESLKRDLKPRADYPALNRLLLSLQNKAHEEPDSSFWVSQVNPFLGINEQQSQGALQPHLCRAGCVSRGRMGILGSWWELCWEGPHSAPAPAAGVQGMLRDQPFMESRGSGLEGSFPQGQ